MLYQLRNGKTIILSVEQYLTMSDEDIEYMISINFGNSFNNPFHGSALNHKSTKPDDEEEDSSIDYFPDSEEIVGHERIDLNLIEDLEELTDFSGLEEE